MTQTGPDGHPIIQAGVSDRMIIRMVHEGTYREYPSDNMTEALKDLEKRGLLYLSPAGYGLTDAGRTTIGIEGRSH